jgi:Predicted ATPase
MTLEGESGVGKLALARAVHQRRNPAAPFHVVDAEGAGSDCSPRSAASWSTASAC